LLAALLASRSDSKLEPVGAFFVQLLRKLKDVRCPDDALAPDDPGFPLRIKPRGLFDERCAQKLDRALSDGSSSVFNCKRNNDGQFSKTSDVVTTGQFSAILEHASRIMGWLSGQLLEGDISIRPYRLHEQSPCSHCEYKPVCRFELGLNRYRFLEPLKREDALKLMQTKGGAA
jgi:ATP-dependent helicase/DNAse subunit B